MASSKFLRGIVGGCCVLWCFQLGAIAQTDYNFPIVNGDCSLEGEGSSRPPPAGFTRTGGQLGISTSSTGGARLDGAYCGPRDGDAYSGFWDRIDLSAAITPEEAQGSVITMPYYAFHRAPGLSHGLVEARFFDAAGVQVGTLSTGQIHLPATDVWYTNTVEAPALTGPVPANAQSVEIHIACVKAGTESICNLRWENFGPIVLTVPEPTGDGDGDGGGGIGDIIVDLDLPTPVDINSVQDALDYANNLKAAACDALPDLSGLGFLPDAWGGAGIGGQIAGIQQQIKLVCQGEVLVDNAIAQTDAMVGPDPFPALPSPDTWGEQTAPDITDRNAATFGGDVYADDLVTAANRANEIRVFQIRQQAALWERQYGRRNDPSAAIAFEAPLIDENDVGTGNMDFTERGYGQTKNRIQQLTEEQGSEPNFADRVRMDLLAEPTGGGSCIGSIGPRPDGATSTVTGMFEIIRWNAQVRIANTDLGAFACDIITAPVRNPSELCFGELFGGGDLCIYGPQALPAGNTLFAWLPVLMLLGANIAVFRMLF